MKPATYYIFYWDHVNLKLNKFMMGGIDGYTKEQWRKILDTPDFRYKGYQYFYVEAFTFTIREPENQII